jgi:hypothetical protein
VNITLEALRHLIVDKINVTDRIVVAHLRMPYHTMLALKAAIAEVERLTAEAAEKAPEEKAEMTKH